MKRIKREDFVLLFFIVLFCAFVGFLILKESRRDNLALNRDDVIKFFSERINDISPEKPVEGEKWLVKRFRFVDSSNVYVEYEDGYAIRAFLLGLTKTVGTAPDYKITGYFEPGPLGYKLLAGEDSAKDKLQEIYEYNETAGKWIKVN